MPCPALRALDFSGAYATLQQIAMSVPLPELVRRLADGGVVFPAPATVDVAPEIRPEQIAPGVVIHAGCRLRGADTWIGPGCRLGEEAPATVEHCQLARNVELKGGYFSGATFLDGANLGSAAHVRPGTLLEEGAGGGHAVGFKQTILFPNVTAGSLINFCDCLMAGGTGRSDHSEIGSSYVHFNFTPHGDKATPSLLGDVPRGVMLDQPRIFLGGQGGLVGPVRLGFGAVVPAGVIWRRDAPEGGAVLVPDGRPPAEARAFAVGAYRAVDRIVRNNLIYLGNLRALRAWYRYARGRFLDRDAFDRACLRGALARLDEGLAERTKRLGELAERMPRSLELARAQLGAELPESPYRQQEWLHAHWPAMREALGRDTSDAAGAEQRDEFISAWEAQPTAAGPAAALRQLPAEAKGNGTAWLRAVVEQTAALGPREAGAGAGRS